MTARRHEKPLRRVNPSGKIVWVARWTDRHGKRRSAGTFELKREAQAAIDEAYDREYNPDSKAPRQIGTVDAYREHWERLHPRAPRTAKTYATNLRSVLDVRVAGREFRHWRMDEVERSEVGELLDHLLRVDGRAANGARGVLRTLSTMWEDAISDGWCRHNPVQGVRVKMTDPRIQKPRREPRIYSWEEMHRIAAHAPYPHGSALIGTMSDCGLRLGEALALQRADIDGDWLWVRRTAHDGSVEAGTKTTRNTPEKARKVPLGDGLKWLLESLPPRIDTRFLFPSRNGRPIQQRRFYTDIWRPAKEAAGFPDARPHDLRHSYVSLMRAAGVDPAHLAEWTGHTVLTATGVYTHPVGDVSDLARRAVG